MNISAVEGGRISIVSRQNHESKLSNAVKKSYTFFVYFCVENTFKSFGSMIFLMLR